MNKYLKTNENKTHLEKVYGWEDAELKTESLRLKIMEKCFPCFLQNQSLAPSLRVMTSKTLVELLGTFQGHFDKTGVAIFHKYGIFVKENIISVSKIYTKK